MVFFVEQRKVWVLEAAEEVGGGPVVLDFENLSQLSPEPSHAEHDPRNARAPLQGPPRKWVPDVSESKTPETASVGGVRVRARLLVPLDVRTARAGGSWPSLIPEPLPRVTLGVTAASLEMPWQGFVLRQTFLLSLLPHLPLLLFVSCPQTVSRKYSCLTAAPLTSNRI